MNTHGNRKPKKPSWFRFITSISNGFAMISLNLY
jgi:hypothetical protein